MAGFFVGDFHRLDLAELNAFAGADTLRRYSSRLIPLSQPPPLVPPNSIFASLRGPLLVTGVMLLLLLLFSSTFVSLAGLGNQLNSHRLLVLPLFLGMIWSLRQPLSALPVEGTSPALIGLALAGGLWLVGELTLTQVLTQIAVVAMVPLAILAVLGPKWVKSLAFPIGFLVFAIPMHGPVIPMLANLTAAASEIALVATGIPVHRDGVYFELPSGRWSIAEACSGAEYLSACLMFAALFAWIVFDRNGKRMAFFVGAAVIGVVGNWVRAYLTMLIAHLSDNRLLREDHGTFGWLLFAGLLFAYCAWGWRYRDTTTDPMVVSVWTPGRSAKSTHRAALGVLTLAVWPLAALWLTYSAPSEAPRPIAVSTISSREGWTPATAFDGWRPEVRNPSSERIQAFTKNGRRVNVYTAVFAKQDWNSKLVSEVNRLADADTPGWSLITRGETEFDFAGAKIRARTGTVAGQGMRLAAWHWYWMQGQATGSHLEAKAWHFAERIGGKNPTGVWVAVYTAVDSTPDDAADTLKEFMRDMGDSLQRSLALVDS